jgi:hypothetical protein
MILALIGTLLAGIFAGVFWLPKDLLTWYRKG